MIDINNLKALVISLARGVSIKKEVEENRNTRRKKIDKEDNLLKSQALLITWMIEDNSLINKIRKYIKVEDFSDELYRDLLEKVYTDYDEGILNPARMINYYMDDEEKSKRVAKIFNTNLNDDNTGNDRSIAINETIIKIKQASLEDRSKKTVDAVKIIEIAREKEELSNLNISFD